MAMGSKTLRDRSIVLLTVSSPVLRQKGGLVTEVVLDI